MTILIVEDEPLIRSVIADILQDEDYQVASAANGLEALTYLRQHTRPRLILLDLGMPVMTGWEFRAEQQRDPRLAEIPVIVMSATLHLDRTAAALKAIDCLDKPIDIQRLLQMVAHYYLEDRQVGA